MPAIVPDAMAGGSHEEEHQQAECEDPNPHLRQE